MMEAFKDWLLSNTGWLYKVIWQNRFVYIDYWSFVHFFCGALVMLSLLASGFRRRTFILFSVLLSYEIVEILFKYYSFNIFYPETIKDQLFDIVVGMGGGALLRTILRIKSDLLLRYLPALLVSSAVSFIAAGFGKAEGAAHAAQVKNFNWTEFNILFSLLSAAILLYIYLKNSSAIRTKYRIPVCLVFILAAGGFSYYASAIQRVLLLLTISGIIIYELVYRIQTKASANICRENI